jgi:hypothetical protein
MSFKDQDIASVDYLIEFGPATTSGDVIWYGPGQDDCLVVVAKTWETEEETQARADAIADAWAEDAYGRDW